MIALCDRCLHITGQIFRSRAVSKAIKIKIYETIVRPVVLYGRETWPVTEMHMKRLNTWERKMLRKGKVKVALWGFSTLRPFGLLYSYPQQVPALISRGATHHTFAWDLYQWRQELLPMNFASKSVIHENSLGSFTCRKAGTWDILFYFPSEGRHTEDFPDARKIRLRPGLNPRTRVPVASMLTTRPPKPSKC